MKKILAIAVCLVSVIVCTAQNVHLSIGMAVPRQMSGKNSDALVLLRKKLASTMTANGMDLADYCNLVICPSLIVTNQQTIEGGMRKITVYDIELSLLVSEAITGMSFNSINITMRGEGYTEETAFMSAINKLSTTDKRISEFFAATKIKVLDYYRSNVDVILTKARTLSHMQQYGEALALLYTYPDALMPEFTKIANEMQTIYSQYQKKNCNDILQQARGEYALGNYDEAVLWLSQIDMQSPCAAEAKTLSNNIKKSIDTEINKQRELIMQQIKTEADLEKQRIRAIENVATAYIKSLPNYYFIF